MVGLVYPARFRALDSRGLAARFSPAEHPLSATFYNRSTHEASRNGPRRGGDGRVSEGRAEARRGRRRHLPQHDADEQRHLEDADADGRHLQAHDDGRHGEEDGQARNQACSQAGPEEKAVTSSLGSVTMPGTSARAFRLRITAEPPYTATDEMWTNRAPVTSTVMPVRRRGKRTGGRRRARRGLPRAPSRRARPHGGSPPTRSSVPRPRRPIPARRPGLSPGRRRGRDASRRSNPEPEPRAAPGRT